MSFWWGGGGRKAEGHFCPPWLELQHRDLPAHLPWEAERKPQGGGMETARLVSI